MHLQLYPRTGASFATTNALVRAASPLSPPRSKAKVEAPWSDDMAAQATEFYLENYLLSFSMKDVSEAYASIPQVMMWDDHGERDATMPAAQAAADAEGAEAHSDALQRLHSGRLLTGAPAVWQNACVRYCVQTSGMGMARTTQTSRSAACSR